MSVRKKTQFHHYTRISRERWAALTNVSKAIRPSQRDICWDHSWPAACLNRHLKKTGLKQFFQISNMEQKQKQLIPTTPLPSWRCTCAAAYTLLQTAAPHYALLSSDPFAMTTTTTCFMLRRSREEIRLQSPWHAVCRI